MSSKFARLKLSAIKLCHTLRIRWVIRFLTNALFRVSPKSEKFGSSGVSVGDASVNRVATVYTNDPKLCREAILANLCTLLRPPPMPARTTGWG